MKKTFILLGCCALMAACSNDNSNATNNTADGEGYYDSKEEGDSAAAAANYATLRQSEVDTNLTNIGTDRTPTEPAEEQETEVSFADGAKLIAQSDCLACHREDQRLVGPAYAEVAEKYAFNDENVDYLAGKIIEGGKGVWGEVPMTPHPDLSRDDASEMARYILSLKK